MCELCNGFCSSRRDDKLGYLDCCLFVKERKRNKIMRWVLKYIFRNRYLMVLMLFGYLFYSWNIFSLQLRMRLRKKFNKKISIISPLRGNKKNILQVCIKNNDLKKFQ